MCVRGLFCLEIWSLGSRETSEAGRKDINVHAFLCAYLNTKGLPGIRNRPNTGQKVNCQKNNRRNREPSKTIN